MRIYLAGPMRGIAEFNFPAFDEGTAYLCNLGHQVCNPADHDRHVHGADFGANNATGSDEQAAAEGFSLREALAFDLDWIARYAEAVAVLPDWENSKGARAEVALARALGLPVADVHEFEQDGSITSPYSDWEMDCMTSGIVLDSLPLSAIEAPLAGWDLGITTAAQVAAPSYEVRAVSSTGGAKGVKPSRLSLVPGYPLGLVGEHYARGAEKYADHNWRKGYEWSKSYDAMQRHALAFWGGEDLDPEFGTPHLAAVVFHAFTLMQYGVDHPGFDDRYKGTL